jgi:hypothetical protein
MKAMPLNTINIDLSPPPLVSLSVLHKCDSRQILLGCSFILFSLLKRVHWAAPSMMVHIVPTLTILRMTKIRIVPGRCAIAANFRQVGRLWPTPTTRSRIIVSI